MTAESSLQIAESKHAIFKMKANRRSDAAFHPCCTLWGPIIFVEESQNTRRKTRMSQEIPPTRTKNRPWVITFFGLLAMAGLISMPILAGEPTATNLPDMVRFIGHFHPVVLHLPIGVFALILFQELGAIFSSRTRISAPSSLFPMFFGAASAVIAAILGFLLYHGHGADYAGNDLAERHLWGGLAFAVAAVLTFVLKAWSVSLSANPAWYRSLLFGSVGVMGFASHDGASMTHGSDYLTQYAPEPLRKVLGLEPGIIANAPVKVSADQVVYADIVAPIFERRCVQCHKEEKSKGKFRMDTYELLVKGGKEGPGIEPGNAAESNIIVRMDLPEDDDEHMPPEGKPDIEDAEVLIIKWWLDGGADPMKTLSQFEVPAKVADALAIVTSIAPTPKAEPDGHAAPTTVAGPSESLKKEVAALSAQFPGALSFESQQSSLLTFSAVSMRGKLDDAAFEKLTAILPHLISLDLSATLITDKSVSLLQSATKLRMVRLAETEVTDAAINSLLKLPALESVNFYGTKITDSGLSKLAAMPSLKRLYLWQTAVTPAAVKALQEKLPECEIVTGSEA